jgi:hypothetical protein
MFSFLILLPLTLISIAIGLLLVNTHQVADYVLYLSIFASKQDQSQLRWEIAAHAASYAAMCFVLAVTARTVSAPLSPDRAVTSKYFQLFLQGLFVAVPSLVLIYLSIQGLSHYWYNWILWLGVGIFVVGLFATVLTIVTGCPLDLLRSSLRPFAITKVDLLGAIVLMAGFALFVSFQIDPVQTANFVGLFPVVFMTYATMCLFLAAIFAPGSSPIAILSIVVSTVVVLQLGASWLTIREFRHTSILQEYNISLEVGEVLERRQTILPLETAFRRWLEHRRPLIEAYRKNNKTFPVFVVAAQGGGIYTGYHAALSLARLYDACPAFAQHVFAISGVSGGSLGSAVFAELLRSVTTDPQGEPEGVFAETTSTLCIPKNGAEKLEGKVKAFFSANFLSPVIASAFITDFPGLFIPLLRFHLDRAVALEYAFEGAWRKVDRLADESTGLAGGFYERWQPEGLAPALLLTTTDVARGSPVIVSQIDWSPGRTKRSKLTKNQLFASRTLDIPEVNDIFMSLVKKVVAVNILDFRPDLQLATSTAVSLSARFPYVTPPANIRADRRITDLHPIYRNMNVLQLLDGGFVDNSGGAIAKDLCEDLETLLGGFSEFSTDVSFHLIQFADKSLRRTGSGRGQFELVAPLVALNNIRLTRPAGSREGPRYTDLQFIYLGDRLFQTSLNWLLTEEAKREIESRSGGEHVAKNEVCCLVGRFEVTKAELRRLADMGLSLPGKVEQFVPNESAFRQLIELVREGANPVAKK